MMALLLFICYTLGGLLGLHAAFLGFIINIMVVRYYLPSFVCIDPFANLIFGWVFP